MERRELEKEEADLLERSVKKAKEGAPEDATMDEQMLEPGLMGQGNHVSPYPGEETRGPREELRIKGDPTKAGRKLISYKDIVLQLNGEDDGDYSEDEDWMTTLRREEEEDDVLEEEGNPLCPVYQFSKKQHKEDCKKWRKALIIKLLGRKISNRFLMSRLLKIWNLAGGIEVIDLDNGYILINFHEEKDYSHVLH